MFLKVFKTFSSFPKSWKVGEDILFFIKSSNLAKTFYEFVYTFFASKTQYILSSVRNK